MATKRTSGAGGMPVILPILLLGLGAGAADDSRAAEEHQNIARIAPVRLGAGADIGDDTHRGGAGALFELDRH
jgi:hypothetical protein